MGDGIIYSNIRILNGVKKYLSFIPKLIALSVLSCHIFASEYASKKVYIPLTRILPLLERRCRKKPAQKISQHPR